MSQDSTFSIRGASSPMLRLWWLRLWSPNPLVRPSDRLEAVVRLVAVVAVVVAIPVAGALGTAAYTDATARIRTGDVTKSVVSAVITAEPERTPSHLLEAPVHWVHNGRPGTATVRVPVHAVPGDHVEVWLGPDGAPTVAPRHPGAAAMTGIGVGVGVLTGTWVLAWLLLRGTVWLLRRRHRAQWDRQWRTLNRPTTEDRQ
ncbi:Rv1733c family protein [Nocardia sp. CA-135953]|uniref:Rv1733c family protein n=1 Tax=Nocardia sp. CA-135953 TaxID=3239978 RepID=UPI003D981128